MKILHLALSFERGGRRRAITTLVDRLRSLGVESELVCLNAPGCNPTEIAESFGKVDSLDRRSPLDQVALKRLRVLCRQRHIDVIHAHDAASQFTAALALFRREPKLVMTFHRSLGFESARWRDRLRNAFACWRSDAIITGSRERQEHFRSQNYVRPQKVIRIPFGIDIARFRSVPQARVDVRRELGVAENTVLIGAIGHFGPEKGIDVVIRAFRDLSSRPSADSVLVLLGDGTGTQKSEMESLARDIPPRRIVFAGFRPDVERWFQAFDLFVHGPRLEAFGLVVAEAMAARLPIVATAVGGIPDMVRPGKTGILVPADSPTDLANAMELLIRDDSLRKTLADTAAQVAEQEYGAELFGLRHLRLYEDILAGRPPRGIDEAPPLKAVDTLPRMTDQLTYSLNGSSLIL